jgi:hypothetical protein
MDPSRSRAPRHHPGGDAAHGHARRGVADPTGLEPVAATDARPAGLPVGSQAIRVFRAARRRRLALPVDQRPRLSPGLVAEMEARGWDIPPELRPNPDIGNGSAGHHRPATGSPARTRTAP